jgi:hypothetical protein
MASVLNWLFIYFLGINMYFSHGITIKYLNDMANSCNNEKELKAIAERVNNVFDVSFNCNLIGISDFKRLHNHWIDIQSNKSISFKQG